MSDTWKRNLPVPFFSQRENKHVWRRQGEARALADSTCNITSLCMVLHYLGITTDTPDEMLYKVFEAPNPERRIFSLFRGANGYENLWSLQSMSHIAQHIYNIPIGLMEVSTHDNSNRKTINALRNEIAAGYPVCISYGTLWDGNVANNADGQGRGHIAVLRGFTERDDVIINDPWGDPVSPFGYLSEGDRYSGMYYNVGINKYYGMGTGDNSVIRRAQLERVMKSNGLTKVFNATLVIRYPHFWSFPVRAGQNVKLSMNPSLSQTNNPNINQFQQEQIELMLRDEDLENAGFPFSTLGAWHDGIHIKGTEYTPVYAMGPGRLIAVRTTPLPANTRRSRAEIQTSVCFALVQHFIKTENNGVIEFFSYYMHLKPVDVNARLSERLLPYNNGSIRGIGKDWLDQIIDHVLPQKLIVKSGNERQIFELRNDTMQQVNGKTVAPSALLCLCPQYNNLATLVSNILENESPYRLNELYTKLNDENSYSITKNGIKYLAFYYPDDRIANRYCVRYVKAVDVIRQQVNVREYAYYRKRLSTLVSGKVAIFLGEDNDTDRYLAIGTRRNYYQVFNELMGEVFSSEEFPGIVFNTPSARNYLQEINTVTRWFKGSTIENKMEIVYCHYLILAHRLLTYPETLIDSPFRLTTGRESWHNVIRNSLREIYLETYNAEINSPSDVAIDQTRMMERFDGELSHFAPVNIDYHIEVNNNTWLGYMGIYAENSSPPKSLIHYAVFSTKEISENTGDTISEDADNPHYVVVEDDAIGPSINCHNCVSKLREVNILTDRYYKNLVHNTITERERIVHLSRERANIYAVLKLPNNFMFFSRDIIEQNRQNAIGFLEISSSETPDLSTYLETTWYNQELQRMTERHGVHIDNRNKVYSYHPVGFLKLLYEIGERM